jgi:hypothetical protein
LGDGTRVPAVELRALIGVPMTRSRLLARSFLLALALGAPGIAVSCGGDSDSKPAPNATGGGGGEMPKPEPIECGAETCTPLDDPTLAVLGQEPIPACCAADDQCGLDSSRLAEFGLGFNEVCQAKHQPGEATSDCPDSAPLMIPGSMVTLGALKGCCRTESQTCGYLLVIGGLIDTELGCVDSTPFLEGGAAPECDP